MSISSVRDPSKLSSSVCTSTQLKSPELQQWMQRLGHPPMMMHRKVWEWAYIAQALAERDMLRVGRRGLGFAVGKEPLVALFASLGCEIVATDLDEVTASAVGWTETNQHARDLGALNDVGLCPPDQFAERVSFRVVDMNSVPDDLCGFDFIWSSCSIEHLGNIAATDRFVSRAMRCLRPGGVAVHTTEFNISSDTDTVEEGVTVILRRSDIERIASGLRREGHHVDAVDFEIGEAADDKVILHPPYQGPVCLKIWIGPYAATSIGLIAEAGSKNLKEAAPPKGSPARFDSKRATESQSFLRRLENWLTPRAREVPSRELPLSADPHAQSMTDVTPEDIRYAYRLLLDREPDSVGFTNYRRQVACGALTSRADLISNMMGSEEFRNKQSRDDGVVGVELGGYTLYVRANDHDIAAPILRSKIYEPHVTAVIREVLRERDSFVDVGANIGYFMALAAHIVGAHGKVTAVEPMDKNLQLLYTTVWRNAWTHVHIQPFAASQRTGLLPMETGPGTSNGQIVLSGASKAVPTLFAQSRTLHELLSDLRAIDLLKIDVEGHEMLALRGFADGLAKLRPRLITEFHPKCMRENSAIDPEAYLAFLFEYSSTLTVLHSDETRVECSEAAAVMREWSSADARLDSNGTTHVDLFAAPRN